MSNKTHPHDSLQIKDIHIYFLESMKQPKIYINEYKHKLSSQIPHNYQ
jgi:hypothetical protein